MDTMISIGALDEAFGRLEQAIQQNRASKDAVTRPWQMLAIVSLGEDS